MTETIRTPRPLARLLGLDALRGVAVFLMIEQHLGVWLWRGLRPGESMAEDYLGLMIFNALGGGAAPAFVTLAGIGSSLLAIARTARGQNPDKTLLLRGLAVLGFGYLLSFLTPSWFTWQSWFVLHLMGLGMLLTPLLRRLPTTAVLGLALAVLGATGFVQVALDVPLALDNDYMSGRSPHSPREWTALRIMLAEGQFPIFPWFAFYLAGLACGRWIASGELERIWMLAGGLAACASVGLVLGLMHPIATSVAGRSSVLSVPFFPASPTLVSLLLVVVLLGIWAMMAWDRRRPLRDDNPIVTLGRASLTLLILHVWLFREATRPIGVWQALDIGPAFAVLIGFLLIATVGARLWQRADYRFGAEWLLRKLAP
jgi:uncharacterized membrane protein